jgi:TRAP-type C4-dicarboxylate transport system permease small subunit
MTLQSIQKPFRQALRALLITLIGTLLALMTVQVVMRYGFNSSLLWAEEICRYLLIWLSLLAVVLAYERGEIAALTILSNRLPRVPALILFAFCTALSLSLCVLLVWYGWVFAVRAGSAKIPAMRFILDDLFGPNVVAAPGSFWVYVALPAGMALMAIRLFADLVVCLQAIGTNKTLAQVTAAGQRGLDQ